MSRGFLECPECKAKPGIPALCVSCVNNRNQIDNLEDEVQHWKSKYDYMKNIMDILWNILKIQKEDA